MAEKPAPVASDEDRPYWAAAREHRLVLPRCVTCGLFSAGRLHGITHWVEAVRQIQNRADHYPGDGARQIANCENVLVATGMLGHGCGAILSKDHPEGGTHR